MESLIVASRSRGVYWLLACQFRKVPNKLNTTEAHTGWNTSYDIWMEMGQSTKKMEGSTCKPGACLEPGEFFHLCQGLVPGYSGMKWVSFRILFEPSGSKAAPNNYLSSIVGCCIVATRTTNGTPALQLHLLGRG